MYRKAYEEIDLDPIEQITVDLVKDVIDDLENDWDGYAAETREVESSSRPGFMAFTDGGASGHFFTDIILS